MVGSGVQRFKVGDRVVGAALAIAEGVNDPAEGAFQRYTVVREHMAAPLPPHVSSERACVLPLALSTAAYGLFPGGLLALDMPVPRAVGSGSDGTGVGKEMSRHGRGVVIVTGGASSVGSNAVQLAVGNGSVEVCAAVLRRHPEVTKKVVASGMPVGPGGDFEGNDFPLGVLISYLAF